MRISFDKNLYLVAKNYYYWLYIIGLAGIVGMTVFFIHFNQFSIAFLILPTISIFIPTVIDLSKIIKRLLIYFKKLQYMLYLFCFLVGYIIYGFSTILSKEYISLILKVLPDTYTDAIYWFNLLFSFIIILCLILFLSIIMPFLYFTIRILVDIPLKLLYVLYAPLGNFFNQQIQKISTYITNTAVFFFGFHHKTHFRCFILSITIFIAIALPYILTSTITFIEKNSLYIIHYTSYFQNYSTCKKISNNAYIKLLGENQVSVSPFKNKSLSSLIVSKMPNGDFYTAECN